MRLFTFKVFQTVAEVGSVSGAAKLLHLTQPAITAQIRNLEADLGVQLLVRTRNGVLLTPQGQVLLDRARQFMALEERLRADLASMPTPPPDRFRLLTGLSSGANVVPFLIGLYRQENPGIQIQIEAVIGDAIPMRTAAGDADVTITSRDLTGFGCVSRAFYDEPLDLIAPTSGILAAGYLLARELTEFPLIMIELGRAPRQYVETSLLERGLLPADLQIAAEVRSTDALMAAVRAGKGLGFLPRTFLQAERGGVRRLQVLDLEVSRPLYVSRPTGGSSPAVEAFTQWVLNPSTRRALRERYGG